MVHDVHPKNSENCCLAGLTMFQLHLGGPLPLILAYQASAAQRRRDRQMQCIRDIQVAQNVIQHLTRHDSTSLDMTRHVASCEMNIWSPSLQLQHLKISQVESQAKCLQFCICFMNTVWVNAYLWRYWKWRQPGNFLALKFEERPRGYTMHEAVVSPLTG